MARQPVRSSADYIDEAWRLRIAAESETTDSVELDTTDPEAKRLARKFMRWIGRETSSKTHNSMVQLILAELENEAE
jgi:hypothetical protein